MSEAANIPIIDISADRVDEVEIAKALVDAAAEYGFVYIRNTGKDISAEQVQGAFDLVSCRSVHNPPRIQRSPTGFFAVQRSRDQNLRIQLHHA